MDMPRFSLHSTLTRYSAKYSDYICVYTLKTKEESEEIEMCPHPIPRCLKSTKGSRIWYMAKPIKGTTKTETKTSRGYDWTSSIEKITF